MYADTASALAHGRHLLEQGADVLDVGGESTRPGATRPLVAEELDRVVPVIAGLAGLGAVVSVDTMRAEVAAAALDAGAQIVNDVSGGLADPAILDVVAASGATYVAMHWRAHSDRMADFATYDGPGGVVGAVVRELGERLEAALAAGITEDRVVLDPGLGFAKRGEHNWDLLAHLDAVAALGPSAARRRQPQELPRHPARRAGRHAAPADRARARPRRPGAAAGRPGRVGAAGARRARHRRRARDVAGAAGQAARPTPRQEQDA